MAESMRKISREMLDNTTTFATIGTDYSSSFILMPRRSKSEELLEFEITFYEKLLHAYPDFVDVLLPLGEAYTRRGLYDKGLEIDLKLTQLRTTDSVMWYNLACSYSLLKRVEESADALRRAVTLGYSDLKFLQNIKINFAMFSLMNIKTQTGFNIFSLMLLLRFIIISVL